ncbi:MAG: endonuclease III [Prevotella sp.]|nr:endonuclease III [Prevotella sp.]
MNRRERIDRVLGFFREHRPNVTTELEFGSAFQLLVATVLSAQCTDKRVNMVTPELFRRFPDARSMAAAEVEDVLELVKSVSYPNSKAQHLVDMSRMIVSEYGGMVPSEGKDLERLPGVGHKTANVVQAVWFGKPTLAVDTHVYRVSHRLGLVPPAANTPLKVEQALLRYIPQEDVADAHHWLILHGRYVCLSQRPKCGECQFGDFCPKIFKDSKL